MMKMKTILTNIIFFAALGTLMSLQNRPDNTVEDCRKDLKDYMKQFRKLSFPTGNTVYLMDISVSVVMSPESMMPPTESRVKMYMNANQLHCVSESVITYQDSKDAFMIFPQRKLIFWSEGATNPDGDMKLKRAFNIQDSVVNLSKIISCQTQRNAAGVSYKVINMEPLDNLKEQEHILTMEYHVNQTNQRLEKAITYYAPGHKLYSRSMTYNELNFNYTKIKMNKPVYYQVFSEQNKLLSKYKGYQIIDKRD